MIFLATASGLMMERVRSTAILALRPNKCEETHNYTMRRVPAWERPRRKRARPPKAKAGRRHLGWQRPIGRLLARRYEPDSTRSTKPITSGPGGGEATKANS